MEDLSSTELLAALESNMVALGSTYGRADGSALLVTPEVVWFHTGIPGPLFISVLSTRLEPDGVKATFDSLQAKIEERTLAF